MKHRTLAFIVLVGLAMTTSGRAAGPGGDDSSAAFD